MKEGVEVTGKTGRKWRSLWFLMQLWLFLSLFLYLWAIPTTGSQCNGCDSFGCPGKTATFNCQYVRFKIVTIGTRSWYVVGNSSHEWWMYCMGDRKLPYSDALRTCLLGRGKAVFSDWCGRLRWISPPPPPPPPRPPCLWATPEARKKWVLCE